MAPSPNCRDEHYAYFVAQLMKRVKLAPAAVRPMTPPPGAPPPMARPRTSTQPSAPPITVIPPELLAAAQVDVPFLLPTGILLQQKNGVYVPLEGAVYFVLCFMSSV